MTAVTGEQSVTKSGTKGVIRKRILIEASKLADENMDGIKRYVVELLSAFSTMDTGDVVDLDVMVHNRIYPLSNLPEDYLALNEQLPKQKQSEDWLSRIGLLVPPILLPPIKRLIPAWASRRFLGKEKSDIKVPVLHPAFRNFVILMLPPVMVPWLQKLIPERLVQYLWMKGILEPVAKAVDPAPYDLIHLTLPNNHHYIPKTSTPMLATVHDLCHVSCPELQTRSNSISLKMGLDRAVNGGASFLAVSTATKTQLINEYLLDPDRVRVTHNGCSSQHFYPLHNPAARADVCSKYHIPNTPFLLALSTIEPRKNLFRTIEAFERLVHEQAEPNINLVIAGARGWKSREVMRAAESSERIHLAGYIADEDLAAIYSSAYGFLYVSHYEGFGLPLLEAMSCGVPVIYGNNSSMPEIVGNAGLAAESWNVDDITRQMRRLVLDDELAKSLGRAALKRSQDFSWERTAQKTLAAYHRAG